MSSLAYRPCGSIPNPPGHYSRHPKDGGAPDAGVATADRRPAHQPTLSPPHHHPTLLSASPHPQLPSSKRESPLRGSSPARLFAFVFVVFPSAGAGELPLSPGQAQAQYLRSNREFGVYKSLDSAALTSGIGSPPRLPRPALLGTVRLVLFWEGIGFFGYV